MLASRVRMATFKDSFFIPEGYVLATDDDFSGTSNGSFRYIGTALKVVIPNRIKGIAVTRYDSMFRDSSVIGVVSYNKNVTNMSNMFYGSSAITLDLSIFDTSKVTNMSNMFYGSSATTLDLSIFDTSKVTNMSGMFQNSSATTGYARTLADADRFNNSSGKPSALVFVVKIEPLFEFPFENNSLTDNLLEFGRIPT